jgi:hypothetical protein
MTLERQMALGRQMAVGKTTDGWKDRRGLWPSKPNPGNISLKVR